jgi:hypothetical protein
MRDSVHLITLPIVSRAFEESLHLNKDCAKRHAMKFLDLFGFDDRIIDNILDQPDRQLFYLLEAKGIVETHREEITLHNGKKWRIRYWSINKNKIYKLAEISITKSKNQIHHSTHQLSNEAIYHELSQEVWTSRKSVS